jgi:hypothetical protein
MRPMSIRTPATETERKKETENRTNQQRATTDEASRVPKEMLVIESYQSLELDGSEEGRGGQLLENESTREGKAKG